jgi:hypothetical protein
MMTSLPSNDEITRFDGTICVHNSIWGYKKNTEFSAISNLVKNTSKKAIGGEINELY